MLFVARFADRPRSGTIRRLFKKDHMVFLEANREHILLAGSLLLESGLEPAGSLWIIEAQNREEAESLCESDPYFKEGVREAYNVYVWNRSFPMVPVEI